MGLRKEASEKKERTISAASKAEGLSGKSSENEIDVIFGKKRRSAPENLEALAEERIGSLSSSQTKKKKKKVKKMTLADEEERKEKAGQQSRGGKAGKASTVGEPGSKPRKKTADGLTVYGEDELKWNTKDAGGTSLCPFDCECCF